MKVSAVLLNWKRPHDLGLVKAHLFKFPWISEVIVWDNALGPNIINYGRYKGADGAKSEFIYTQDDDCLIENLDDIYQEFARHGGDRLVNGMKPERMNFYGGEDSLAGWGMFFRQSWSDVLDDYIKRYGEDYIFYRETDRIFTTLLRPIVPRITVSAKVRDFASAMDRNALSLQIEHEDCKAEALRRCREINRRKRCPMA